MKVRSTDQPDGEGDRASARKPTADQSPDPLVGELVEALGPAQRAVLTGEAVRDGGALHLRDLRSPATRCALARRGILVDRMYSAELTPLGERVRALLLSALLSKVQHPVQDGSVATLPLGSASMRRAENAQGSPEAEGEQ